MMPDLRIQQAIALVDVRGVKVSAWTDGLYIPEVERIAVLFGQRPSGVACPLAHFACPFGKRHIAVVRVEDRPGSGDVLGFRFLILARDLYRHSLQAGITRTPAMRAHPQMAAPGSMARRENRSGLSEEGGPRPRSSFAPVLHDVNCWPVPEHETTKLMKRMRTDSWLPFWP